jgi:hypothetical protein
MKISRGLTRAFAHLTTSETSQRRGDVELVQLSLDPRLNSQLVSS